MTTSVKAPRVLLSARPLFHFNLGTLVTKRVAVMWDAPFHILKALEAEQYATKRVINLKMP
jgi:hypothetical protein